MRRRGCRDGWRKQWQAHRALDSEKPDEEMVIAYSNRGHARPVVVLVHVADLVQPVTT